MYAPSYLQKLASYHSLHLDYSKMHCIDRVEMSLSKFAECQS